jgi:hypothetical protein
MQRFFPFTSFKGQNDRHGEFVYVQIGFDRDIKMCYNIFQTKSPVMSG